MINKLGHYIFKRICKDQDLLRKKQAMNIYGLYVRPKNIQSYINDYVNYGIDYMGEDNDCADDRVEHYLDEFFEPTIDKYWDEPEGNEG